MIQYAKATLRYFYHCQHGGSLASNNAEVCIGEADASQNNERVKFYLQIKNGQITKARFQAYGSVVLIAACQFLCEKTEGLYKQDLKEITAESIIKILNLPQEKMPAVLLALKAWKSCI